MVVGKVFGSLFLLQVRSSATLSPREVIMYCCEDLQYTRMCLLTLRSYLGYVTQLCDAIRMTV